MTAVIVVTKTVFNKKRLSSQKKQLFVTKIFSFANIFHKKTCFTEEPKSSQKKLFFLPNSISLVTCFAEKMFLPNNISPKTCFCHICIFSSWFFLLQKYINHQQQQTLHQQKTTTYFFQHQTVFIKNKFWQNLTHIFTALRTSNYDNSKA